MNPGNRTAAQGGSPHPDDGGTPLSTSRRGRFSAEFKVKGSLESIRGEQSTQELAARGWAGWNACKKPARSGGRKSHTVKAGRAAPAPSHARVSREGSRKALTRRVYPNSFKSFIPRPGIGFISWDKTRAIAHLIWPDDSMDCPVGPGQHTFKILFALEGYHHAHGAQGNTEHGLGRESSDGPARPETPSMRGDSPHGNPEIPEASVRNPGADRPEKAQ